MAKNRETTWTRLDNAGKIFPPTSDKRDTKVFRFSCELFEDIAPTILQQALDKTVSQYPVYCSVLKKGLFWYYLESSNIRPLAKQEYKPPCSPLYIHNKKSLLFEVTYYKRRINLEVYHAISDGTGAMQFLKTLVTHYIILSYPDKFLDKAGLFDSVASYSQKMDDSFNRYFSKEDKGKPPKRVVSHIIRTPLLSENRLNVIESTMPLDMMLKLAKDNNTTLTVLLTAVFLCAVNDTMSIKERKKPVIAVVPVNLRKYFSSESVRNFFGVINVGYDFSKYDGDINTIFKSVNQSFKDELTIERLKAKMNQLSALEHNVFARPIPLLFKDIIMKIANRISDKEKTISVSNIGKIDINDELKPYIRMFDVFVSTKIIQICICSFGNNLNIGFSSAYSSTDIQMFFFRYLTKLGIPVELNNNSLFEDDEK